MDFGYDGQGRRVARTVDGARTDYWYDVTGLTRETGAANATYLRDPGGLLLSSTVGSTTRNYGRDRLGSITALVGASGDVVRSYRYDPWGTTLQATGSAYNPFQYTGTYQDAATGYYQMGARYYQPASGRFTQLDPLPKMLVTNNRYAYAGCNPANYIDPTGLDHIDEVGVSARSVCEDGLREGAIEGAVAGGIGAALGLALGVVTAVSGGVGGVVATIALTALAGSAGGAAGQCAVNTYDYYNK